MLALIGDVTMETNSSSSTDRKEIPGILKKEEVVFAGVGTFPLEENTEGANVSRLANELRMTVNTESVLRLVRNGIVWLHTFQLLHYRFTEIPQQKHPIGATPMEITLHNLDLTYTLETFLECNYKNGWYFFSVNFQTI